MTFYDKTSEETVKMLKADVKVGLTDAQATDRIAKNGENVMTKSAKKKFSAKIADALKEPMLIILLFAFFITTGTNLGKAIKSGDGDFAECVGILLAVVLSVSITLIMEGSSEKAFNALNRIYDNVTVKVLRNGKVAVIPKRLLCVGDVVMLDGGDKIVADGRLLQSENLLVDESALTGESTPVRKNCAQVLNVSAPLAERVNCVYSGTFVTGGTGTMVVTAVGDGTEIGNIAKELGKHDGAQTPLNRKLAKLGKTISVLGTVTAVFVFAVSAVRLAVNGALTFGGVQELFVSCIVLIVAAVPEGLPTIVAVSLALNMIKLAGEHALIKKMSATETAGAVSVICSDKTGTLTQNKMTVTAFFCGTDKTKTDAINKDYILQNFACNSTAEIVKNGDEEIARGSATECALLKLFNNNAGDYAVYRKKFRTEYHLPFSSETKYMITAINTGAFTRFLLKGAGERVLDFCALTDSEKARITAAMRVYQEDAKRVVCFAHKDVKAFGGKETDGYVFDGFAVLSDPVRPEVIKAVADCRAAGIRIKILTGDNAETAFAVAREINLTGDRKEVINASELENLDDDAFRKAIADVKVIARSTPIIKLRVVKALSSLGEVVAVTGDGINDAPAIKRADVGIAMGVNGSEITKEAADIVLLDDSFATVVKAVSFGRNVYRNLQRFILFQLSVNLTALLFVTVCAIAGLSSPFSTLQLLWINVIMDGPPALTLGLERANDKLMTIKPVRREASIVSPKMFVRILFNGIFMGVIISLQYAFNFLGVSEGERNNAVFTLFIMFQSFNAFNCRELGAESIFKRLNRNKVMLMTFGLVTVFHFVIVNFVSPLMGKSPLTALSWLKCTATAFSVIIITELFKAIYRPLKEYGTRFAWFSVDKRRVFVGKTVFAKRSRAYKSCR